MSAIALITADKVNFGTLSVLQYTGVASSAVTAGAPIYYVAATGRVAHSDGNGAAPLNSVDGVSTKTAGTGEAVTFMIIGLMDGWDLSGLDYGAGVYLSDTVGRLDTAPGTTPIRIGTVVPVFGTTLGTAADKVLLVHCGPGAAAAGAAAAIAGLTPLTDSTGLSGTHDDTLAATAAPVTLTDSTGLSGSHNDTLAAVTTFTPSVAWDGATVFPSATDATAIATAITVLNQNASDTAQKVIEILTLLGVMAQNQSDTAQKVNEIVSAAA